MLLKRVLSSKQPMPRIRIRKTLNPQESIEPPPKKPCNAYPNSFGSGIFGHRILVEDAMEPVDTRAFVNDDDSPAIPPQSSSPHSSGTRCPPEFCLSHYHVCRFDSLVEGSISLSCLREDFNRTYGSSMKATEAFWINDTLYVKVMSRCDYDTVEDNLQQVLNRYTN